MPAAKGQATLDAAREREAAEAAAKDPNVQTMLATTPESGYERPKTLRQLEHIVESNALKGAGFWRKAADALLAIKTHRLWKEARDENGDKYPSFVVYAEERFGFKKTYAYDLVKAAQRKPEAVTEGSARAEMRAERAPRGITSNRALELMLAAWTKVEDRFGDIRDRVEDDDDFIAAWDSTMGDLGSIFRAFVARHEVISGEATDVTPLRSPENDDLPGGYDDADL